MNADKSDAEKSRQAIAALRSQLVRLHIQDQELVHLVGPNLRRIHLVALGALELRRLRAEHAVRRLRRKSEVLQTSALFARPPDLAAIEQQLDLEFAVWAQRIRTLESEVAAANRDLGNPMSDAAEAEFKRTYRELVERLHPELPPSDTNAADLIWPGVNAAYARHDLPELRLLVVIARDVSAPEPPHGTAAALELEETRLTSCVRAQMEKMAKRREQQPFSLEPFLGDNAWVEHRRREIEAETATLETQAANLELRLAQLLPVFSRGQPSGQN